MPILIGTDGTEKMSKSLGNYIGISDSPKEIFGKTLSIPDALLYTYFELATDIPKEKLDAVKKSLADPSVNPRNIKRELARTLVCMYYSSEAAAQAEEEFDRIFVSKSIPNDIETSKLSAFGTILNIGTLITDAKLASSKSEARRLIEQGGVSIDGERVTDFNAAVPAKEEFIIKVGKRKFLRIQKQ